MLITRAEVGQDIFQKPMDALFFPPDELRGKEEAALRFGPLRLSFYLILPSRLDP
ncbi:hypothetical protein [Gorillibacterium timonense]|uniref:hypothetical protein n=1 Tax=Gorillibacterium timonense TaxID=1689269 RepID=UPI00131DE162|nr:hypothetical protein [Gorillibacterium timonense]